MVHSVAKSSPCRHQDCTGREFSSQLLHFPPSSLRALGRQCSRTQGLSTLYLMQTRLPDPQADPQANPADPVLTLRLTQWTPR